jgi:hypothetical protein
MIVADTDVLTDFLAGHEPAAARVAPTLPLQADSLIAGIVLAHNGILLTRNRRHFQRVTGLQLADPAV